MKYTYLSELRKLRNTIKACEARIDEISDQATEEAASSSQTVTVSNCKRRMWLTWAITAATKAKTRCVGGRRKPRKTNPRNIHLRSPRRWKVSLKPLLLSTPTGNQMRSNSPSRLSTKGLWGMAKRNNRALAAKKNVLPPITLFIKKKNDDDEHG